MHPFKGCLSHAIVLVSFELPLKPLAHFEGSVRNERQDGILFSAKDYLALVDFTGRIQKKGKRGFISEKQPHILQRLELDIETWILRSNTFEENYQKLYAKRHSKRIKAA